MDAVLATSARRTRVFVAGCAGTFFGGRAFQSACRTDPPPQAVFSVARIQSCAERSAACVAALCGIASYPRSPGVYARSVADTVRIRGCRGFANSRASDPGIHGPLRASSLRRRALRYIPLEAIARSGPRGYAGTLKQATPAERR